MSEQEKHRSRGEELLRKFGVTKIEIELGKLIFYFEKKLIVGSTGSLRIEHEGEQDFGSIGVALELFFGKKLIFRATRIQNRMELLEKGVDSDRMKSVPGHKDLNIVFATEFLSQATEYGHTNIQEGDELSNDLNIMIYDGDKMLRLDGESYAFTFKGDPKDALLGMLVLKSNKAKSKWTKRKK